MKCIAFAGGGTGGHIYPILAVIHELRRTNESFSIVWIGVAGGPEEKLLADFDVRFETITTGKLRRYFSVKNVADVFRIVAGIVRSVSIIKRYRPCVLFAKGGYASVPPVLAARLIGTKIITHESDLDPGLATKINARFASRILIPFDESKAYYSPQSQEKLLTVGVPVRSAIVSGDGEAGRKLFGIEPGRRVLLVLGGSQGARRINELIVGSIDALREDWFVIHQTGVAWDTEIEREGYRPVSYLSDDYPDILAAADCVVCRAGATTLWEVAILKKAAVLLPLGMDASRGDQIRNARFFADRDSAFTFEDIDAERGEILRLLKRLAGDERERNRISTRAHELIKHDAASSIARLLLESAEGD